MTGKSASGTSSVMAFFFFLIATENVVWEMEYDKKLKNIRLIPGPVMNYLSTNFHLFIYLFIERGE